MNDCHNQFLRVQDVEEIGASLPSVNTLKSRVSKRIKLEKKWTKETDIVKKAKLQKDLQVSTRKLQNDIAKYKAHYTKLRAKTENKDVQELQQELVEHEKKVRAATSAVIGMKDRVKQQKAEQKKAEDLLKQAKKKQKEAAKLVKMRGERDRAQGVYKTLETQLQAAKDFDSTNNI